MVRYEPLPYLEGVDRLAHKHLGEKLNEVMWVIGACRELTTDQTEIIATLYACWSDLLIREENDQRTRRLCATFSSAGIRKRRGSRAVDSIERSIGCVNGAWFHWGVAVSRAAGARKNRPPSDRDRLSYRAPESRAARDRLRNGISVRIRKNPATVLQKICSKLPTEGRSFPLSH